MTTMSKLLVRLDLESAKFREGLDKANKTLTGFGDKVSQVGKVVAVAFAAKLARDAVVGLASFITKGAEATDKLGKLAAAVGTPVDELSRLAYAASFSGLSTEELGSNLGRLAKLMTDAAAGGKSQSAVFDALGVSLRDSSGGLRTTGSMVSELAEKFATLKDGTAKTAIAQELFGKSGAAMIPLLNGGAAGIGALAQEAERFGLVVTPQAAIGAAMFNDSLARLKKVGEGLAMRVAEDLAPSITRLTEELFKSKDGADALKSAADALADAFRVVLSVGVIAGSTVLAVGRNFLTVAKAMGHIATGSLALAAGELLSSEDLVQAAVQARERVAAIWTKDPGAAGALAKQDEEQKKAADAIAARIAEIAAREAARAKAAQANSRELERQKKLAEDIARIDFGKDLALEALGRDVGKRRQGFANAGATDEAVFQQRTAGFAEFNDALDAYSGALREYEEQTARSQQFAAEGDAELARAAQATAVAMQVQAEQAAVAADAFTDRARAAADRLAESFAEVAKRAEEARRELLDRIAGAFGRVSGLIKAGQEGAAVGSRMAAGAGEGAVAGGPLGAVLGVLAALLTESQTFASLLDVVAQVVGTLADGVGEVIDPAVSLVAALAPVAAGLGALIAPFGVVVEAVTGPLIPPLVALGAVFAALAPLMQVLAGVAAMMAHLLMMQVTPVLYLLFEAFRLSAMGMLWAGKEFGGVWNSVVSALQGVFKTIASIEFKLGETVFRPFGAVGDWAKNIEKAKINTAELAKQFVELQQMTWEDARAKAEAIRSQEENTAALQKATGSLLNVPQGFKLALARFAATAAEVTAGGATGQAKGLSLPQFASGGVVTRPTVALVGEGGEAELIAPESMLRRVMREESGATVNVTIVSSDPETIWRKVKALMERDNYRARGARLAGAY